MCLEKLYRYHFEIEKLEKECQNLNETIQELTEHNNKLNSTINDLLNFALDNIDLDKIPKIHEICQNNSCNLFQTTDDTIRLKLREIEQKIEKNNIAEALQEYKSMKKHFSGNSFFDKKITEINAEIENKLDSAFMNLRDQISIQLRGFQVSDEIESELHKNLDYLIEFSQLMKKLDGKYN
jgi:hypothetical protein